MKKLKLCISEKTEKGLYPQYSNLELHKSAIHRMEWSLRLLKEDPYDHIALRKMGVAIHKFKVLRERNEGW